MGAGIGSCTDPTIDVYYRRRMPHNAPRPAGPGIALARDYFVDVVEPLLDEQCKGVRYAAARVGTGSDVFGLDDRMSQDHDFGLRLQLFVSESDAPTVLTTLERHLPEVYRSRPVRFAFTGEAAPRLGVDVMSPQRFAHDRLGFDPTEPIAISQWLSVSGQAALELVAGEVFTDQVGDLGSMRSALEWYPDDIWRYVVACDWRRIDQEFPLMARAGDRGDELGSRAIAGRLVEVAVHLAFMLSQVWPPYSKWRGIAFQDLPIADQIAPCLHDSLSASDWHDRNDALGQALRQLADLQSLVGLPAPTPVVVPFWDRPYEHINQTLVPAVMDSIVDPAVRELPVGLGGIDQRTDNVDVLISPERRMAFSRTR